MNPQIDPQETWSAADRCIEAWLHPDDPALAANAQANAAAGLPPIDVSAAQGKFLCLLAQTQGARSILEIGTLGGFSTTWLARALPEDGRLITLELDPTHARVARGNLLEAGVAARVEVIEGPAAQSLARLHAENRGPFDFIFIDADKPGYSDYLDWALKLSCPGTVIVADNVVRQGMIADPKSRDANVQAARAFIQKVGAEPRLNATVIQTVGKKGHDGYLFARVLS
jgi:predicted O-methyltransferase YrrM